MKIKTTLLLFTLSLALIYLAGCSKNSNNSIVGSWNYNGNISGFTNTDTLFHGTPNNAPGKCTLNFLANGHFTYNQTKGGIELFLLLDTNNNVSGTYYYNKDTLIFYDTLYPAVPFINKVAVLNSNSLTLVQESTLSGQNFQLQFYFSR